MPKRTSLELPLANYGRSVEGRLLQYIDSRLDCDLLIIAGIHGEEADTTVAISRALRSIAADEIAPNIAMVLCANPDGLLRGTRGNANGVDLNRNFPTADWKWGTVPVRWHVDEDETLEISTGTTPASEPESRALIQLVETLAPSQVLTLHGPLACVDDPNASSLGIRIAEKTGLTLVSEIGYPTPGSMGTWAKERGLPWITWEFPRESIESISKTQVPVLVEILKHFDPTELSH